MQGFGGRKELSILGEEGVGGQWRRLDSQVGDSTWSWILTPQHTSLVTLISFISLLRTVVVSRKCTRA